MVTQAQIKAQSKYDRNHTQQVKLKLNSENDSDILALLKQKENKQGFIKELLRKEMRSEGDILSMDSIRYLILPVVKRHGISSVALFGSYARNEATSKSDVDLLIGGGDYDTLFEFIALKDEMAKALGRDVDIITQKAFNRQRTKSEKMFKENIEKELVTLYEENKL